MPNIQRFCVYVIYIAYSNSIMSKLNAFWMTVVSGHHNGCIPLMLYKASYSWIIHDISYDLPNIIICSAGVRKEMSKSSSNLLILDDLNHERRTIWDFTNANPKSVSFEYWAQKVILFSRQSVARWVEIFVYLYKWMYRNQSV